VVIEETEDPDLWRFGLITDNPFNLKHAGEEVQDTWYRDPITVCNTSQPVEIQSRNLNSITIVFNQFIFDPSLIFADSFKSIETFAPFESSYLGRRSFEDFNSLKEFKDHLGIKPKEKHQLENNKVYLIIYEDLVVTNSSG